MIVSSTNDQKHLLVDLDTSLELNLISNSNFKFADFKKKEGIVPYTPIYSNWLNTFIFGKSCKVYIGEFAKHPGIYSKHPPLESRYVTFESLGKSVLTLPEIKAILSKQDGYYEDGEIKTLHNANGVALAIGNFSREGGKSYFYTLTLGANSILISNSNWIDIDSIVIKK